MKVFTRGPARPHARKLRSRDLSPSKWKHKMLRIAAQAARRNMTSSAEKPDKD